MLRQVTNGLRGLHNPQCPLLHSACITCFSTSTSSSGLREEQQLAAAIADRLSSKAPESAASALVEGLSTQQRTVLLKALGRDADAERVPGAYVDKLFKEVDTRGPFQQLDKQEFTDAMKLDRQLTAAKEAGSAELPSWGTCTSVAIAAGVPFVGFGFLDNGIMLVAGEEIDATFGVKFGLSTLASAGLGNLVSDVAGIGFAEQIEMYVRKLSWAKAKPVSLAQRRMLRTRVAKTCGSVLGVTIGCLLGMLPLLWMNPDKREAEKAKELMAEQNESIAGKTAQ